MAFPRDPHMTPTSGLSTSILKGVGMPANDRLVAPQFSSYSPGRRWRDARQQVRILALSCALLIPALSPDANAADPGHPFLTLTFENDLFVGRDQGYTNGTGITYGRGQLTEFDATNTPAWIRWMCFNTR